MLTALIPRWFSELAYILKYTALLSLKNSKEKKKKNYELNLQDMALTEYLLSMHT